MPNPNLSQNPTLYDDPSSNDPPQIGAAAAGGATSGVISSNGNSTTVTSVDKSAPFNAQTEVVRNSVYSGKIIVDLPSDMINLKAQVKFYDTKGIATQTAVKGSLLTSRNKYYCASNHHFGNDPKGLVPVNNAYSKNMWEKNPKKGTTLRGGSANTLYDILPKNSVLPNCVGGARGRYQELIQLLGSTKPFPNNFPHLYENNAPFKNHQVSKTAKSGYVKKGENFYLWQDTNGTYGPKGGCGGYLYAKDGGIPLPGAMVVGTGNISKGEYHIEFIDAVYNFGTDDCYFYTHASASGHFDNYLLRMGKRSKLRRDTNLTVGTANGNNGGPYGGNYSNTRFLYTPLCDFSNAIIGAEGNYFDTITVDYTKPPEEQQEAYDEIRDYIAGIPKGLVVGQKVAITALGNQKPTGAGRKVNKIGGEGGIKKIGSDGMPYRYEVADRKGSTIGCFSQYGIYLKS